MFFLFVKPSNFLVLSSKISWDLIFIPLWSVFLFFSDRRKWTVNHETSDRITDSIFEVRLLLLTSCRRVIHVVDDDVVLPLVQDGGRVDGVNDARRSRYEFDFFLNFFYIQYYFYFRCQFHQHFTRGIFIRKFFAKLFYLKQWPLLTNGRCSEVIYVIKVWEPKEVKWLHIKCIHQVEWDNRVTVRIGHDEGPFPEGLVPLLDPLIEVVDDATRHRADDYQAWGETAHNDPVSEVGG